MPDIFYLISKWWKQMLLLIILAVGVVAAIVFMQTSRYLSVATALPASSVLSDKARIFNKNIESLYSSLGNPDDLDRILGTAQLDTVYLAVAKSYNLWDHYKIKDKEQQLEKSADLLRKYSRVIRSAYGELKIKVWDTDKNLAPKLANAILEQLNVMHQSLQSANNKIILKSLQERQQKLAEKIDSFFSNRVEIAGQAQYEELIAEYQLMVDTNPPALIVVEKARAALHPDKPKVFMLLAATAVLSFIFALLVALLLERRKRVVL